MSDEFQELVTLLLAAGLGLLGRSRAPQYVVPLSEIRSSENAC